MECTTGALGPKSAEVEGPATAGQANTVGPVATMSTAEDPTIARKGPAAGEEGPWRTRGLKE